MLKDFLLNKNIYGLKYFIKDYSLLKYLDIKDLQLYKIGTTRRLDILFNIKSIKQYVFYKKICSKESSFINISCKNNMFCASFIADKKYNMTLDMIISSKDINCISKERILEFCETL